MIGAQISSYLDETLLPYPFCPGCGHGVILDHLNSALVKLQLDPRKVVIVSDIGCSGLSDKYFSTNAFHGLHGRSVTYATGIKLANPDLKVIVLMGDGGCGIGGHHLLNAARRNIGVTVLVFNNFNYGMTGGEHSVTTPMGANTTTTRYGNLEQPMDICATVSVNGASLVVRTTAFDDKLPDLIVEAVRNEGFSLIDIWEFCTAYYVPNNRFNKRLLESTFDSLGFQTGIVHKEIRPEYSRACRSASTDQIGKSTFSRDTVIPKYQSNLSTPKRLIIAGAAGKKIATAANAFSLGAVLSGLWATQRNDYLITVKSGYSVAEVILSPEEIYFAGISKPDIMVVLFHEGLHRVLHQIESLSEKDILLISEILLPVKTNARKIIINFGKCGRKGEYWAMMAMAEVIRRLHIYPLEAFIEAVSMRPEFAEKNLAAIEASVGLFDQQEEG